MLPIQRSIGATDSGVHPSCSGNAIPPVACIDPRTLSEFDAYCSIDTIELFSRRKPDIRDIVAVHDGNAVILDECVDRRDVLCGYILRIQQPSPALFPILDVVQIESGASICRFDLALDIIATGASGLAEWLRRHAFLVRRPLSPMYDIKATTNWSSRSSRAMRGLGRPRREIALYADRHSKVTGELDCAHFELKFCGSDAVRRAGCREVFDILRLDPCELFERHVRLYDFDEEQFTRQLVRRIINDDRLLYQGAQSLHPMVDRYRSNLAHRTRSLVKRVARGRVQLLRNVFGIPVKAISLDVLRIPDRISPLTNRQRHAISSELFNDINAPFEQKDTDIEGYEDSEHAQA